MELDKLFVKTIRKLSLDIVENAGTGHLGISLGAAPIAYELFKNHLNIDPQNTAWFNRDRFVLSAGHGTPLLYSVMNLFGYDITIDDLKKFRKLGSITPGHPEVHVTNGVDATTGPLGQGFAMAVGMAIAEKHLGSKFNKDDIKIVDHYTYVLCGDGDLMEGVSMEASSVAGSLGLEKLVVLHDSNKVCSDGFVKDSTIDNYQEKFSSMGWDCYFVPDGEDIESIGKAIELAKKSNKPSYIEISTIIGRGSSLQGTNAIHSDPVGKEEALKIKENIGWNYDQNFFVPDEIKTFVESYKEESKKKSDAWNKVLQNYKEKYPQDYKKLFEIEELENDLSLDCMERFTDAIATRAASGKALNFINEKLENLVGGSADLATSNKVVFEKSSFMSHDDMTGNNIAFGIREFSMAAIVNGLTLHGGVRGFCATFLVFSDYMRSAIRHASIMKINPIFIFTHDSIIVGPDGPTHQPVEQLQSLRAMPDIDVIRPCDGNETINAWEYAIKNKRPTIIVLGRQNVPIIADGNYEKFVKGAYVIDDSDDYHATIIATGSEVSLALKAKEVLEEKGIRLRIVNMPSWELFEREDRTYQDSVIDRKKPVISIEASSGFGWERYTGKTENVICVNDFGESGNGQDLYEARGFNVKDIVARITEILS